MAAVSFSSDLRDFLFRCNPIPMFLYASGSLRIRAANDAAIVKYGYTAKEFRSMTIRDLHPCSDLLTQGPVPTVDTEAFLRSMAAHVSKQGNKFEVKVQVIPFPVSGGRKLFLMSAVVDSAASNATLIRSEQIHRSLVEECPFGIYRLNLTTARFEQANPACLLLLGYSLAELCSINVPTDLYVEAADRDRLLAEMHSTSNIRDFETRFRKKGGGILRASISGYLGTNPETNHQYIQGFILDVTHPRELEAQLNRSLRMEAISRLAGGVAHDFNNITQSISLSCELVLSSSRATAIESKLLDIIHQASRAADITRQLLAFSCGQLLQPRVVDLNDCVRETLPELHRTVGRNVLIVLKLDDTIESVIVDPDQLAIVLMHLAANARTAMPEGGLLQISTTGCSEGSEPLKNDRSERCAVLTVSDNGYGMDEKTLRFIFEPFFSTRETTLTSGLGLATVHGIISQSNGYIECDSRPGQGATFRIYLPIAEEKHGVKT